MSATLAVLIESDALRRRILGLLVTRPNRKPHAASRMNWVVWASWSYEAVVGAASEAFASWLLNQYARRTPQAANIFEGQALGGSRGSRTMRTSDKAPVTGPGRQGLPHSPDAGDFFLQIMLE